MLHPFKPAFPSSRFNTPIVLLCSVWLAASVRAEDAAPFSSPSPENAWAQATQWRPAAVELNWTPLTMPTGERSALLGATYLVALGDDWGFGPATYGAAQGNYGGLFTAGFTAQHRWRLTPRWHLATSLYAGAGGGVSSDQVRAGGGLMLRPEMSLRREWGAWYAGLGAAHVRFPSGNIKGSGWTLVLGRMDTLTSFSPGDSGRAGRVGRRTGMGFDEIALHASAETPRQSARNRDGQPLSGRKGKLGADLRQYMSPGTWWGVEASGAAAGGIDGYMEMLAQLGGDVGVFSERLRVGAQVAVGLGGGGHIDTGSGWLWRAGPTLRWITPWGPTLRLEGGVLDAPRGHYTARQLRVSLALPLEPQGRPVQGLRTGTVRPQAVYLSLPRFSRFTFKDGSREGVTGLGIGLDRGLSGHVYSTAQAGSAAIGKAGAFSYGLFGLGVQTARLSGGWRVGAEGLIGAAGGGSVAVEGGAIAQQELWAQWEGRSKDERLRLKLGVGHWQSLRGNKTSTPLVNLRVGWAFGTLGP